jgi:outer membrane receptor for ferrienterochelin and colicins
LLARNRAFLNLAWEVGRWKLDYTVNSIGSKRIPSTSANPSEFQLAKRSPSYYLMNAQVARTLGKKKLVELYLGGENLTNYFQRELILSADQPFGTYFDASLVWGPVYGRMFYSGIRWKIK